MVTDNYFDKKRVYITNGCNVLLGSPMSIADATDLNFITHFNQRNLVLIV